MKMMLVAATAAVTLLAACNDEEETAASTSCTIEELQEKATEVVQGLQENPTMAQELMAAMQELGPQMEAIASAGEVDEEALAGLCNAYDELIAKF